jgi:Flp pilus assembly CpaE family ATPase
MSETTLASASQLDRPPDPSPASECRVVAVCGLGGGAGTTTLSYLLALHASRRSARPILALDTGGPGAALAAVSGSSSPLSLPAASEAIARGLLERRPFASLSPTLRLIARPPLLEDEFDPEGLATLVAHARAAHELVVCDCATLQRPIERALAGAADRIVWVTHATRAAVHVAHAALPALTELRCDREALVARPPQGVRAERRALLGLAGEMGVPLVLVANVLEVSARVETGLAHLGAELEAVQEALR